MGFHNFFYPIGKQLQLVPVMFYLGYHSFRQLSTQFDCINSICVITFSKLFVVALSVLDIRELLFSFKADQQLQTLVFWYKARKKVLELRQTKAPHLPQILAFPKQGQVQTGSLSHKKVFFFPYRMQVCIQNGGIHFLNFPILILIVLIFFI